ncbi:MAG: M3 family metallopeptidase [Acidimicrobiia bacterium]
MPLDFTSVTASGITEATADAIAEADALVASIDASDPVTVLERASTVIGDAGGSEAFMARVHPDPEVRLAGVEAEERLTKWANDLTFRRPVYEALADFAGSDGAAALDGTARRLLDHWLRDFRRAGHELEADARHELQRLRIRLIELEVAFGRNLDEWDDGLELEWSQLDGLPQAYIDGLKATDDGRFRVSMEYPDYVPFMQQATDREARRQLQGKFWNRAVEANRPLLEEAVRVRLAIARLLGYPTWAHYALEVKMAADPANVDALYRSVVPGLTAKAQDDLATLTELLHETYPGDRVESWDWAYLDDQQRRRLHGIDQNEVAAYFPLEAVVAGMFDLTGEVFGLEYEKVVDTRAWHDDVALYEIRNRGSEQPIASFYADLFPRSGKYGHAAAFAVRHGMATEDGGYRRPTAAIVANFTKPTATAPSLLKHGEAVTLFHEFGHILHFCLTTVAEARFSGYDTEWDFVEAPSQIMENWMWEPETLERLARHHDTGEPIPSDLVARLVAARDLNIGLDKVRQVFLGKLDLGMHAVDHEVDLMEVYREAYAHTQLPFRQDTFFAASFGHLMGGYDAGYYGYLWAAVYGDDMFSEFERVGITSPEVGMRYRHEILATGGSRDAIDHLRAFLGREPNSDAFLRRLGLS